MTISAAMSTRLNEQITIEFSAAHAYLAMALAFDQMGLKNLHKRFLAQHDEEREHGMKIVGFMHNVGSTVTLDTIPKPQGGYKNVEAIVRAALDSELEVTRRINDLVTLAESEKDFATRSFLQWFVDEQVEEVATMTDLLNLVKLAGNNVLQVEAQLRHEMASQS